jgi:hypothetical protein
MRTKLKKFSWCSLALALAAVISVAPTRASAQDQDDPPGRVARLGYLEGSVSFRPAGEDDWVGAVPNRPMSTGDQIWTDQNSRAEVQLGSAVIRLSANTGFSFLNLDDNTVQIQLTAGVINVTVRRVGGDDDFEVDTPNQAFNIFQPGHYRVEAGSDGDYTVISVRGGEGESDAGGQSYTLRAGQEATLSGTDQVYADVEGLEETDGFDQWSDERDHRHDYSRSSRYLAPDMVGVDDLDDYGDWRDDGQYGHVWFPNRVAAGWAPYHDGHWDWIAPWGWTWVDDSSWGYAPFHYGRWVSVQGRWGWVAGPVAERPVYAPALVVFVGGGPGGFSGNVGWFPLGPREVYVPTYHVSEAYVNRVNISSTTVNVTQVTNVYRTTIVNNNTTTITNVTYANRNVQGAVTVVPQHAFASAQPVGRAAVAVNAREIAAAPVNVRASVAPTHESVMGSKSATMGHVAAPPAAVANRQVVAKKTPPPPPVPFAKQQQALAAHPGQPLARNEVKTLRPAAAVAAHPMVKVAPPAKPATPTTGHPANLPNRPATRPAAQPANQPANNGRPAAPAATAAPGQPNRPTPAQPNARPEANQPNNRPQPGQPENRPVPAQPNARPEANQPNNRPQPGQPENRPAPAQPNNHPEANQPNTRPAPAPTPAPNRPEANQPNNRPQPNRPNEQPTNNRPPAAQPNSRPEATPNRPAANQPPAAQPNNRPEAQRPEASRPQPAQRPATPPPARNDRPPVAQQGNKPAPPPAKQQPKPMTPEEKKKQQEEQKKQ